MFNAVSDQNPDSHLCEFNSDIEVIYNESCPAQIKHGNQGTLSSLITLQQIVVSNTSTFNHDMLIEDIADVINAQIS